MGKGEEERNQLINHILTLKKKDDLEINKVYSIRGSH
jgi:hypothetical protein